ncbi:MAG: methionyl-tRNA formyltransferase [[Eubacterium] siraeum]
MNIVFMGTPDFAVSALEELHKHHNVMAVFTQPDKPKNRGKKMQAPPVKECAEKYGIPVYQPLSLRKGEDAEKSLNLNSLLRLYCGGLRSDSSESILELPKYKCINIHASLLPKYRGAAPIQKCIIDGETESGVTTMLMAKGLDTGDMLMSRSVKITPDMTGGELHDSLAATGGELIIETLKACEEGTIKPVIRTIVFQPRSLITKEMCRIDFSKMHRCYNFIRGMSPSPCAYTFIGDKRLKVYFAVMTDMPPTTAEPS